MWNSIISRKAEERTIDIGNGALVSFNPWAQPRAGHLDNRCTDCRGGAETHQLMACV